MIFCDGRNPRLSKFICFYMKKTNSNGEKTDNAGDAKVFIE